MCACVRGGGERGSSVGRERRDEGSIGVARAVRVRGGFFLGLLSGGGQAVGPGGCCGKKRERRRVGPAWLQKNDF